MTDRSSFDPAGPLPTGTTVLEASAGTGKTWSIAALVTRYVAEAGVPIDEILAITFTRAATSELRERVRSRLAEAHRYLAAPWQTDDPILLVLGTGTPSDLQERSGRLEAALSSFDRATISTIHGFAHRLLVLLGFLSATPQQLAIEADFGPITDEVLTDLSVARFAGGDADIVGLRDLRSITWAIVGNPDARIVPAADSVEGEARTRSLLAGEIRSELHSRAERLGLVTYDDLLVAAQAALTDPAVAAAARRLLRLNFSVALVDEFQDTDRTQWDVVSSIFGDDGSTLVIIGDPKQAIYAFRGADVTAYLSAVATADHQATLTTNWRSDGPLLTALDALLDGVSFGDPRIAFHRVGPAPGRDESRVPGLGTPLRLRLVPRGLGLDTTQDGSYRAPALRSFIAGDAADEIVRLLSSGLRIPGFEDEPEHPLSPRDIAVLCRTHREVSEVRHELEQRGVPAVVGRTGSVLTTPSARNWLTLLLALEIPQSTRRVRHAALTPFVGWDLERLAAAGDAELMPLQEDLVRWSELLRTRGVPSLLAAIEDRHDLTARTLLRPEGERTLTDLLHVAELLHSAARQGGVRSLAEWLVAEMDVAGDDADPADVRARRLETDADAVQLLTIHGVKGLEFPVVLCPYLWAPRWGSDDPVPVFHDPASGERLADVGGKGLWDGFAGHAAIADAEEDAEEFRTVYVALTRARHHLVAWWGPGWHSEQAPFSKMLFARDRAGDPVGPDTTLVPVSNGAMHRKLQPLLDAAGGTMAVDVVGRDRPLSGWVPPAEPPRALAAAVFDRPIDRSWRRTSFTGLTGEAAALATVADIDVAVKDDEPAGDPEEVIAAVDLPLGGIRGGLQFGNLVHGALERVDFTDPALEERLVAEVAEERERRGLDVDPGEVAMGLLAAVETPLGAFVGDVRLRDLEEADTIRELSFEVPVRPGRAPISTDDLAAVLADHLPPGHPLEGYPPRLAAMNATEFHGYLSGAIDLTARLPDPDVGQRYWVADYKSNRLGPRDRPSLLADYGPAALADEMVADDYVLQALLYRVALHRYLRWRLPGYDPDRDLGGALYFFVRGMVGPDTPVVDGRRLGVFMWEPDAALIAAVSDLFDGGRVS